MEILNKTNFIYGAIAALGTAIFGKYWFLFAAFLILNFVDFVTGLVKAKYHNKNESSKKGAEGIIKKILYWVVIGVAFFLSTGFMYIGEIIGIDLGFLIMLGYFTLATYIVNEVRSILENCVEMGVNVPSFLTTGLDVVSKKVDNLTKTDNGEGE